MTRLSNVISKIEEYLMAVFMFSIALVVILAVFFRYFFNSPLSWAGEVSVFLLIWMSFIGGSWGLKHGSQASVTLLLEKVPPKTKRMILIVQHILMIIFLLIVLYFSYKWIFLPNVAFQKSSSILLPMWIPYSAVPIGITFATIHLITNLLKLCKGDESTCP
jgi:C4-dicarboxylate transporter, DctQ subunit